MSISCYNIKSKMMIQNDVKNEVVIFVKVLQLRILFQLIHEAHEIL